MATQPGWAPWPFLAALMSSSASGDAPRVHGLGFVYRGVVVTLAHIAEAAEFAEVAGERHPASVRPLTAQDGLAVMTLERPPPKPVPVTLALAKGPVEVAIASDIALSIRVVSGLVDEVDSAERFSVALNGRLGEDSTASGSPVVVGDTVVGIVAPTATSVSVDAFGAAAIERLVAPLDRPQPLAEGAMRAVGEALEIARSASP